ncbi:MAG: hypothetical protein E7585_00130 [Ruminococcaceae bacterium]|nr:hypothetical protein [Oscillospiraceae bacterium]
MRLNRILLFIVIFSLLGAAVNGCDKAQAAHHPAADSAGDDSDFLDVLTFLGDSTTAHMQQRSKLRVDQIWAAKNRYLNLDSRVTYAKIIAPDTGQEQTIAEVAQRLSPKYLVITLGVDYGVYYYRDEPQTFAHYYEKLLSAISNASESTTLILQSIFPVGRNAVAITNQMIQSANDVIRGIAFKRGLVFVDQTPVLSDAEGYLKPEYCYSEDGIHLTASAYDAILKHIVTMEAEIRGRV